MINSHKYPIMNLLEMDTLDHTNGITIQISYEFKGTTLGFESCAKLILMIYCQLNFNISIILPLSPLVYSEKALS